MTLGTVLLIALTLFLLLYLVYALLRAEKF